ncbi:MAG: FtsX-like permease family protein, partial [Bryobacteraceae bacterium]
VAPGFFSLLRIPLLEGRDFTNHDEAGSAPVMIVNETFARRFFAGQNPVGRKVHGFGKWFTIVGLVKVSKYYTLIESPRPFFFVPFRQLPPPKDIAFYIRTVGDAAAALPALRREALALDPNAGTFDSMPLLEFIGAPLFPQRFAASLLSALGVMSLLLAAVGLYSVMAYVVSQRTHEIGIRLAVGARPRDVLLMVIWKGIVLVGTGLLAGIAAALVLSRLVSGMLVNVSTNDPMIFIAASLFLLLVALLASYLPARRAGKVDPLVALRHQ